jgi:hypothetical protein
VVAGEQGGQVPELVVRPILVDVMDLVVRWDRAMGAFPHVAVLANDAAALEAEVDISVLANPAISNAMCHDQEIAPGV